jgi:dipeptidyl aminopeptidase/acylaminoacyl peptidase
MNSNRVICVVALLATGCSGKDRPSAPAPVQPAAAPSSGNRLVDARRGFKTTVVRRTTEKEPVPEPPAKVVQIVRYDAAVGKLPAYLTPDPKDGKKHPAIVWITGGDCNSIGDEIWKPAPPSNDQTASAFRTAGIVMMFPSLRGGNENPGEKEGFFGEVDDILAAADFLAKQDYVDPKRIYLGGHSTGGTLVLLTAEASDRFRATFSFGPVENVAGYPPEYVPFDTNNRKELELRAPVLWLGEVRAPVFVFEGARDGNMDSLRAMQRTSKNSLIHFLPVTRADHFSILAPVTKLLAAKVLADDGPACNIAITPDEANRPVTRPGGRRPVEKGN